MKKIFLICIIFVAVSFVIPQLHALRLRNATREGLVANDVRCARLTDELSVLDGVWEVAVLSKSEYVLVGVRCTKAAKEDVFEKSMELVKMYFPSYIREVGVEDALAFNVTELAYFMQTDMNEKVIENRFWFLAKEFDKI